MLEYFFLFSSLSLYRVGTLIGGNVLMCLSRLKKNRVQYPWLTSILNLDLYWIMLIRVAEVTIYLFIFFTYVIQTWNSSRHEHFYVP